MKESKGKSLPPCIPFWGEPARLPVLKKEEARFGPERNGRGKRLYFPEYFPLLSFTSLSFPLLPIPSSVRVSADAPHLVQNRPRRTPKGKLHISLKELGHPVKNPKKFHPGNFSGGTDYRVGLAFGMQG